MNNIKTKLQKRYPNATFPAPFAKTFNIKFTKLNAGKAEGKVIVNKKILLIPSTKLDFLGQIEVFYKDWQVYLRKL